jgi:integrase
MRVTSEGPIKITRATIDAAWRRRGTDHRVIVRDRERRGLALIVNATSMTWAYSYRPRGVDPATGKRWPNKTITIGNPASHTVDDARTEANRLKGQAAAGIDPAAEKRAKAAEAQRKRGDTLSRLVETYERVLPKRPKLRGAGLPSSDYVADELTQLRLALSEMKVENKPAADLTVADVRRLLDGAVAGTASIRARFGSLTRFLDWCQDTEHIKANPCVLITRNRRPKAPQARTHFLTLSELARLWKATERLKEPVWRDLARFLIAVPCRRGEAARLNWLHVDLPAAEWRQPGRLTKNRDLHRLHLHSLALDVLRSRHKSTDGKGLVFPAPKSGDALHTFNNLKSTLTDLTGGDDGAAVTGWTWHDMRRSFATALGEVGIPEVVADAILNHRQAATRGGVLGVYQRATRWPEQVRAMVRWGQLLNDAINGRDDDGNVVPLVAGAR